jgi:predicted DNA-binding transcriptional regulator YafY
MTETSGRLLKLLALLQARRDWSGQELADRLEVSCRTVRRDVERLRELGYPVDALTGPSGGYRLRAGTAMPPLLLDDDETVAIAVGLSGAASASVTGIEETSVRALLKLEQVLPAHLRRRVNALRSATATIPATGPTVDPDALTAIAAACRDRERLRFGYRSRDGADSRRRVEPHGLVNLGRRWYLVAWDCERRDWRSFRLDRMEQLSPAGTRFAARELPGGDAAAYVAQGFSDAKRFAAEQQRWKAHVVLDAPADEMAARHPTIWGSFAPRADGRCDYRTSADELNWIAVRVATLGVPFEVVEPPELRDAFGRLAIRFARAAGVTLGG